MGGVGGREGAGGGASDGVGGGGERGSDNNGGGGGDSWMLPSLLSSYAAHPFGSVVLRRARVRVLSPHYTTRTLEETFLYDTYGRFNQAAEVLPLLRLPLPVVGGATSGVCGVLGGLGCQHRLDAAGLVRAAKVRRRETEIETEKERVCVCVVGIQRERSVRVLSHLLFIT